MIRSEDDTGAKCSDEGAEAGGWVNGEVSAGLVVIVLRCTKVFAWQG